MPTDLPAIRSERSAWPSGALRCLALTVVLSIGMAASLIAEGCIVTAERILRK